MKGCREWVPIHVESEPGALAPVRCFSVGFCALIVCSEEWMSNKCGICV